MREQSVHSAEGFPGRDAGAQATFFDDRVNQAPARLAELIEMRRELLEGSDQHPEWTAMEAKLSGLLKSLLDTRYLRLVRLDLHTPTSVLGKIVEHEAVHRIRDSRDLGRRLAEDRRCYAFFHPALPDDPLIFTEVALTRGMSSSVQELLDPESPTSDPSTCDCAIFYSISSCHQGLKGVPLGGALIRRVADELAGVFPRLKTFATLSPVQGFRTWLTSLLPSGLEGAPSAKAAGALTSLESSDWYADVDRSADLARQLVPLCAYYLLRVKRVDAPADPVARFHLRNGARLDRINWLSDTSPAGMRRAAGMMANYVYRCIEPRRTFDAFAGARHANASRLIERLADKASLLISQMGVQIVPAVRERSQLA